MSQKLTLEDFVKDDEIEIIDTKKPLLQNTREEINNFILLKENKIDLERKRNFYEIVPKTKLEATINKLLNKNETIDEKNKRLTFQHNFDAKMRRIKRIKSKSYRRSRRLEKNEMEKEEEIENGFDEEEIIEKGIEEEVIEENAPIFDFSENNKNDNQHEIVKLAFEKDMEENEEDFINEKEEIINENTPKVIESILPGWGDWAGPGLEIVKNKFNTITEIKKGVNYAHRKDFEQSHVIINEENNVIEDKYKSKLPYGYTKKDYEIKLNIPVSKECNSSRMYKKILKSVVRTKSGENIEPFKYEPEN